MDLMIDSLGGEKVPPPSSGADAAAAFAASGGMDELFARIDAGELELTGSDGFIPGLIKAALERGLAAELSDHLGFEKGAAEASLFSNSRCSALVRHLSQEGPGTTLSAVSVRARRTASTAGRESDAVLAAVKMVRSGRAGRSCSATVR